MTRPAKILALVAVVLLTTAVGVLAVAAHAESDQIPKGMSVGHVQVGGLTPKAALIRLQRRIGAPARRPVSVRAAGQRFTLTAARAGVAVDLRGAVRRALARGRDANFAERGWRHLTGGEVPTHERADISVRRAAVRSFVDRIERSTARAPVDATFDVGVEHVSVSTSTQGRRLSGTRTLTRRILHALRIPSADRTITASTTTVQPHVTRESLWREHPTTVTVSHAGRLVRVFRRSELVKTYHVAVGDSQYPTPNGTFAVQTMQKNPVWNVPNSEWAGKLAGKAIPGGDPANPLVARWIGFDGSVGFHGTKDAASIGQAASHGCVRMNPGDVTDLYDRVRVGTTVLVGT